MCQPKRGQSITIEGLQSAVSMLSVYIPLRAAMKGFIQVIHQTGGMLASGNYAKAATVGKGVGRSRASSLLQKQGGEGKAQR